MNKEYKNIDELLEFVLKECGDITYFTNKPNGEISLVASDVPVFDYILMADKLMEQYFDQNIVDLNVSTCKGLKIPSLKDTKIKELKIGYQDIPTLPITLNALTLRLKNRPNIYGDQRQNGLRIQDVSELVRIEIQELSDDHLQQFKTLRKVTVAYKEFSITGSRYIYKFRYSYDNKQDAIDDIPNMLDKNYGSEYGM